MSEEALSAKEAYFHEEALLDIPDDEQDYQNQTYKTIGTTLSEARDMPPPSLTRQMSSFLGPTPKERRANFEAYTERQRITARQDGQRLTRSSTAPGPDVIQSFPVVQLQIPLAPGSISDGKKLKRVSSYPQMAGKNQPPFYKQVGVVPRDLKSGKNVKLADKIKLESEQRQLLKHKVVYFYPNDDISMIRRTRIHKVIQLGGSMA